MSRTSHNSNLAGRMGRWSATHRKTAIFGWLAFTVVAFLLGGAVGTTDIDATATGPGQSGRMDRILDAGFKQPAAESILIQSRSLHAGDAAFRATIGDVTGRVSKLADVTHVRATRVAADGRPALVEFDIRGEPDTAVDRIQPVLDTVAAAQRGHPAFFIGEFGDASAQKGVET